MDGVVHRANRDQLEVGPSAPTRAALGYQVTHGAYGNTRIDPPSARDCPEMCWTGHGGRPGRTITGVPHVPRADSLPFGPGQRASRDRAGAGADATGSRPGPAADRRRRPAPNSAPVWPDSACPTGVVPCVPEEDRRRSPRRSGLSCRIGQRLRPLDPPRLSAG